MRPESVSHVWYTSYGSNCARDRFLVYLRGGDLGGAAGDHHGARDSSDPIADGPAVLPTNLCFTGHTRRWGGAPAFLEHRPHESGALGRRYLVTLEQFADVHAQENRRRPGDVQLPDDITDLAPGERRTVGDRAYDTIVGLEPVDGHPALTFTAPSPPESRTPAPPSASYLATILHGLREVHDLDDDVLVDRLLAAPGVADGWTRATMRGLLDTPLERSLRK